MLTDIAVKRAKPLDKPYKLSEKGMYLLVNATGKYWRMDYRFNGKRKTLALGVYPDVSLAAARDKRDNARKLLAESPPIDPSEKRKHDNATRLANQANTFEKWADKWWQNWHKDKSPRHADYVKRRLEAGDLCTKRADFLNICDNTHLQ